MNTSTEAPASFNFRITYKGVEVQFTHRDMETKLVPYLEKAKIAVDWALENGFGVVPPKTFGKAAAPKEYADYPCPKCGSKVVKTTTKNGKKVEKCETQKFFNGVTSGCAYTKWINEGVTL